MKKTYFAMVALVSILFLSGCDIATGAYEGDDYDPTDYIYETDYHSVLTVSGTVETATIEYSFEAGKSNIVQVTLPWTYDFGVRKLIYNLWTGEVRGDAPVKFYVKASILPTEDGEITIQKSDLISGKVYTPRTNTGRGATVWMEQ